MPQAVTVYRWDDPGAPQLTNRNITEFINILKKCLVEGYGTKDPLGWTLEYEDAPAFKAVFRNNVAAGGSGGYVQVNSSNGTNSSNIAFSLTPAKSMAGVDGFIQRGYQRSFGINTGWTNWLLIGTAIGFYFIAAHPTGIMAQFNQARENCVYVGDFVSVLPADAGRFIVACSFSKSGDDVSTSNILPGDLFVPGGQPGATTFPGLGGSATSIANFRIYDADNADFSGNYTLSTPGAPNLVTAARPSNIDISRKLNIFSKGVIGATGFTASNNNLYDRDGISLHNSLTRPGIRGFLPGFLTELTIRYGPENWPVSEVINGHNHWLLRSSIGADAKYWINMEEW